MIKQTLKYKTWDELAQAFRSGELDTRKNCSPLMLDNDCRTVCCGDEDVFEDSGDFDFEEMAQRLGIPTEWV